MRGEHEKRNEWKLRYEKKIEKNQNNKGRL